MARMIVQFGTEMRGLEELQASFCSAADAVTNAWILDDLEPLEEIDGIIVWQGMSLNSLTTRIEGWTAICEVRPAPALILFAGWLMSVLPDRARVTWTDGWPLFYCPPNDDRDSESDPTPLVPNELVPA